MQLPGNWTQTVQPGENVLKVLETQDITLLDLEGKPFAVLVAADRYRDEH